MWMLGLSTGFLLLVFVAWWRASVLARLAAVGLAIGMYFFSQPGPYRALRRAALLPDTARVTTNLWTRRPATPYESGMFTMYEMVKEDVEQDADFRFLAVGILTILALVPGRRPRSGIEAATVPTVATRGTDAPVA